MNLPIEAIVDLAVMAAKLIAQAIQAIAGAQGLSDAEKLKLTASIIAELRATNLQVQAAEVRDVEPVAKPETT